MASTYALTGAPTWTAVSPDGYALQAPALHGSVTEMTPEESATRSGGAAYEPQLLQALADAGITPLKTLEIDVTQVDTVAAGARSGGGGLTMPDGEPAIAFRAPSLGPDVEHVVLHTDENGVSRWIFPSDTGSPATPQVITRGGAGASVEFLLPRDVPPPLPATTTGPAADPTTRGRLTKLGRRLVRVLAWATEDVIGAGALAAAAAWEEKRRPYALRHFPFNDPTPIPWDAMRQGRSLLLIHGTFSTAQAGFGLLPAETIRQLQGLYGPRMFAFDHPSLHQSPGDNAQRLLEMLPAGADLEVDIVTHSRGGLVGRELTERQHVYEGLGEKLRVRRAVFVAAPHRGTILADSEHGIKMLDRYTNLFTELPDNPFTIGMEAIFMLAKLMYHGAARSLPGLNSMYPSGDYLSRLNAAKELTTRYHALSADFKPTGESLLSRFGWAVADAAVDGVFGEANDGVIPTAGGYAMTAASSGFPIAEEQRYLFSQQDGVHHCNYFGHVRTSEKLLAWLGAPEGS